MLYEGYRGRGELYNGIRPGQSVVIVVRCPQPISGLL
jgi:hypothetical protein